MNRSCSCWSSTSVISTGAPWLALGLGGDGGGDSGSESLPLFAGGLGGDGSGCGFLGGGGKLAFEVEKNCVMLGCHGCGSLTRFGSSVS